MNKPYLKAKLPAEDIENARQPENKEIIDSYNLIAVRDNKPVELVKLRLYMDRSASASVVYACIWVHGNKRHLSGHGQAGGYGYYKRSEAAARAIDSAGIELFGDIVGQYDIPVDFKKRAYIGGTGMSSVEEDVRAIGKALGCRGQMLIVRN